MAASDVIVQVTDENFAAEIGGGDDLYMIDFWASWCRPCLAIAPFVDELADEYADKGLKVGKLNVDENPRTPAEFAVRAIPQVLFFKGGEHVDTVHGAVPKAVLEAKVQEHL